MSTTADPSLSCSLHSDLLADAANRVTSAKGISSKVTTGGRQLALLVTKAPQQNALGHETPVQAFKQWQMTRPHVFEKNAPKHPSYGTKPPFIAMPCVVAILKLVYGQIAIMAVLGNEIPIQISVFQIDSGFNKRKDYS